MFLHHASCPSDSVVPVNNVSGTVSPWVVLNFLQFVPGVSIDPGRDIKHQNRELSYTPNPFDHPGTLRRPGTAFLNRVDPGCVLAPFQDESTDKPTQGVLSTMTACAGDWIPWARFLRFSELERCKRCREARREFCRQFKGKYVGGVISECRSIRFFYISSCRK